MRLPIACLLASLLLACGPHPSPAPAAPAGPASAPSAADGAPPRLRLPGDVQPFGYEVSLTLLPEQEHFDGEIDIDLQLRTRTSRLWLNGEALQINEAALLVGERSVPAKAELATGESTGFLSVSLAEPMGPGRARLHLRYRGVLSRRDNDGLFAQREGKDWYAFSDFEPTDARRAFPCFDEPSYKVPWKLTLKVRRDHVALSNAPVDYEEDLEGGMKLVRFKQTPPLPSYLVALAAGPFDLVDAGRAGQNGTPLRIVTFRGRGGEARYAAKVSRELFNLLEDYFGIPYAYEKLDQIAVPKFQGAMENPGLITYAQLILLTQPGEETAQTRRRFASVAAHEMAHQWFGNLVTLRFWDDIWLNESFASWMEERILERWQPTWDAPGERVRSRSHAMNEDGLSSARSVRQPIKSTHDIRNAFDTITYAKGQALLEMFESYVGEERFRAGVRRYLSAHAMGNADAEDFLAALSSAGGRELGPALRSFLDQPGVPLITMEPRCEQGRPPAVRLRQSRYLPVGAKGGSAALWQVPVCARDGRERACTLLTGREGELQLPGARLCGSPEGLDVVVGNAGAIGYYRVRATGGLEKRLLSIGKGDLAELSAAERAAMVDDLGALLRAGSLPAEQVVQIALRFAGDDNRHVLQGVMEIVGGLRHHLVPREQRPAYAALLRAAFGARARALGLRARPGEPDEVRLLRRSLVGLVGSAGEDPALRAEARRMADAWLRNRKALAPEDVELALRLAGRGNDPALFDRLVAAARGTRLQSERARLLGALSSFTEPALVSRALSLVLSDDMDVRDTGRLLFGALEEDEGAELAYGFVKEHFDELVRRLPQTAGAYLINVGGAFCDEAHRSDVAAFFKDRAARLPGGPRELEQLLEGIHLCAALKAAQGPSVAALLQKERAAAPRR